MTNPNIVVLTVASPEGLGLGDKTEQLVSALANGPETLPGVAAQIKILRQLQGQISVNGDKGQLIKEALAGEISSLTDQLIDLAV
ncbi:hypothetical protein CMI37_23140 [Candidatus Pacearchaeota archaeon]|nr:hypothetical protein [Candidatus Pacearchaeota archaeon]|tara:strand:- start:550 stop:804 length:255 start_codon:yes stop_codon:yes gene_type:complete